MVSNRRRRCMLICLGLVMEIRIVVVVTAVLACFVQVRESSQKNERFFLVLEEEQGLWLKIVNQHSVLHCMYRCFAAFASCLRMCVGCNFLSWNRETASRQAEVPPKFWNFGRHVVMMSCHVLERGKKTFERRPPHCKRIGWTHKANSMTNKIQLDLVTIVIRIFNLLP